MRAYISVGYGKRQALSSEINSIIEALNQFNIHGFVFGDNYKFDPPQEKLMMESAMVEIDNSDILIA